MNTVLQFVAKRAGFDLPPDASDKIVEDSGGNLRKAILVLEALKMQSYESHSYFLSRFIYIFPLFRPDLTGPLSIAKPDWEVYCHKVADLIVSEQSPARVMEVRGKFYELLSHCIPPTVILKVGVPLLLLYEISEPRTKLDCGRARCRACGRSSESGHYTLGGVICL